MCMVMHGCGHAYTPGLWIGGCPWCALAPKADTPVVGRYFDRQDGGAYQSGAQLLSATPSDPTLYGVLAGMKSGQTSTIGGGASAEFTITRVL